MDEVKKNYSTKIEKTLSVLKVRAGRANPAILDKINADYYGVPTPLKSLANISVPDPRTLLISPFDTSCIGAVEKAINEANLGLNPSNDGKVIRLIVPQLTEERRKELTKQVAKYAEEAKVAIRNVRRDAMDDFKAQKKKSEMTEDDYKVAEKDIQNLTDKIVKEVEAECEKKEKELLEI